uniref:Ig-like domain-containing protein n=1 Tax=Anopheles albimanus TaxID=7167 RepID=A0A182F9U4_ANOAL
MEIPNRHHYRSPQPPQYVYWQRNDRMINYDDSRRDISIETTPGPRTQSRLIIREPQINDSGNYTCSASNTEPASIYVFVSKDLGQREAIGIQDLRHDSSNNATQ